MAVRYENQLAENGNSLKQVINHSEQFTVLKLLRNFHFMLILEDPVDKSSSVSSAITTKYNVKNKIIQIKISPFFFLTG